MNTEYVQKLKVLIAEHPSKLMELSDEDMLKTLGPGLWSGKEILGHIYDSGTMNRQRFIRSQYEELYEFPFYDQDRWVKIQSYNSYKWTELISRCTIEYQHLIHILENLPDASASNKCHIKFSSSDYVTLDWLIGHLYRHTDFHLQQIYWIAGKGDLPDDRILNQPIEDLP